ncbi:ribosome biogenesis protein SLX9 homolog [Haliotis rufescens]|uniref:ribosome biogenesis protein SLX9 homolog n=1 Tax=Haliotis rufescens TaxID=6454 RepID=UPI001EB07C95|nr:ribosome biogenesis protein SLX9 homolog [Haliotis rufescens]
MGKVKRQRSKLHNTPIKTKKDEKTSIADKSKANLTKSSSKAAVESKPVSLSDNIFSSLKIDNKALAQKLPDFDARSTVTSKTFKGLNLKKKDKRKIRHEVFMQKIDAVKTAKQKVKDKKKREKTPIVGDMSVMEEALPTLELLMKEGSKSQRQSNPEKVRGVAKERKRRKQMLSDIAIFKQVLEHPAFIENPTATISEHLQNKLKQEEEMDT